MAKKVGRNDPCPCGSGRKYKKCHLEDHAARAALVRDGYSPSPSLSVPPETMRKLSGKFREMEQRVRETQFGGPRSINADAFGRRQRMFRGELHVLRPGENFHQYLVGVLVRSFGTGWLAKYARPNDTAHVVRRWLYAWDETGARGVPTGYSGDTKALLTFADDMFRLQLLDQLPRPLMNRLRDPNEFQGARYEVCAASLFARCGFQIEWEDTKGPGKHCEFIARHPVTKTVLGVEAKSRHRRGVLNRPGPKPDLAGVGADVGGLFREALEQNPGDKPFVILIDLNLPREHGLTKSRTWVRDIERVLRSTKDSPSPYSLLVVTNYSWHYDGSEPAGGTDYLMIQPVPSRHVIDDPQVQARLGQVIHEYGSISPTEGEPESHHDDLYRRSGRRRPSHARARPASE